ncbi:unnamed protein product [Heterobilharzia americana]|nr:unnamed protein product [Heterobilharzia americana]
MFKLPSFDNDQREAIERAKTFTVKQSIKKALEKQSLRRYLQSGYNARRSQTLDLLNRIYVGSICYDLREDAVPQVFSLFGIVPSVNLRWDSLSQKHRGFAFLEFEYPEAAFSALQNMNNVCLRGRQLFGFMKYESLQSDFDAVANMNMFVLGGQYLRT